MTNRIYGKDDKRCDNCDHYRMADASHGFCTDAPLVLSETRSRTDIHGAAIVSHYYAQPNVPPNSVCSRWRAMQEADKP